MNFKSINLIKFLWALVKILALLLEIIEPKLTKFYHHCKTPIFNRLVRFEG